MFDFKKIKENLIEKGKQLYAENKNILIEKLAEYIEQHPEKFKYLDNEKIKNFFKREFSISEKQLNRIINLYIYNKAEIENISIKINDGNFEIFFEGKKYIHYKADICFAIYKVILTEDEKQIILKKIRDLNIEGKGFVNKAIMFVITAVIYSVFGINIEREIFQDNKNIKIDNDLYYINFKDTTLNNILNKEFFGIKIINILRVKDIKCQKGKFIVYL